MCTVPTTINGSLLTADTDPLKLSLPRSLRQSKLRTIMVQMIFPMIVLMIITLFDKIIVILSTGASRQYTLPLQMWSHIRQEISPKILSAATIPLLYSIVLLTAQEMLLRRSEGMRGFSLH